MCLLIKESQHKSILTKRYIPSIAEEDIVCYKVLWCSSKGLCTPFMFTPILFTNDECIYKAKFKKKDEKAGIIEEGIHAYTSIDAAKCNLFKITHSIYEAVIPKGTKYFIGFGNYEIVAEYMIIKNKTVF